LAGTAPQLLAVAIGRKRLLFACDLLGGAFRLITTATADRPRHHQEEGGKPNGVYNRSQTMKHRFATLSILSAAAVVAGLAYSAGAQSGLPLGFSSQVFVIASDGSGLRQLTSGTGSRSSPTWSPDGKRLAYAGGRRIRVITLASGEDRALSASRPPGGAGWVQWSPAREELAVQFGTRRDRRTRTAIGVLGADGKRLRRLASWPSLRAIVGGPAWSPDGNRIAYMREGKPISSVGPLGVVGGGHLDVSVISRNGHGNRRFGLRGDDRQPVWSPDGRWILFGRVDERLSSGLWRITPTGRRLGRVGRGVQSAAASWSPDGKRIEFTGHVAGPDRQQHLYVLDATREALPRRIAAEVGDSDWSPGGDLIAFTDFNGALRVTAPDGSAQRTLATFAADTEFRDLTWSPDGRFLAFTAEKQRPSD
jgi:TolB protein